MLDNENEHIIIFGTIVKLEIWLWIRIWKLRSIKIFVLKLRYHNIYEYINLNLKMGNICKHLCPDPGEVVFTKEYYVKRKQRKQIHSQNTSVDSND